MISKSQIKLIKGLSLKKNRIKKQLFIVEGEKNVADLLVSDYKIEIIYATREWINNNNNLSLNLKEVNFDELKKLSNQNNPNNVLALVKINKPKKIVNKGLVIVLDGINDPGNLGTIIRICDWFAIKQIVCSTSTVDLYNPKVVQSSMGSLFRINIIYKNLSDYLSDIKVPVYAACINGENVKKTYIPDNMHLVMGNESNGISDEVSKYITKKVSVKKLGAHIDSLNVAIATGILLHEFCG